MNQITIADIAELKKGSPIIKLQANIKKAFEPTEGEGQYGTWKCQGVILADEGNEIRATFWDRFNLDFRNLEGEDYIFISGEDGKGKFSGITVDEYKGKKQIKCSKETRLDAITGETPDESGSGREDDQESGLPASLHGNLGTGAPAPSKRFVSEQDKRESIEKQVALKAAVDFLADSEGSNADSVVIVAGKFYEFLHGDS